MQKFNLPHDFGVLPDRSVLLANHFVVPAHGSVDLPNDSAVSANHPVEPADDAVAAASRRESLRPGRR